ncbi:MAG: hypothetical protein K2H53_06750, partial [Clostridia bacterium]|nr:hypothetical protein [Clostridia bacterium]
YKQMYLKEYFRLPSSSDIWLARHFPTLPQIANVLNNYDKVWEENMKLTVEEVREKHKDIYGELQQEISKVQEDLSNSQAAGLIEMMKKSKSNQNYESNLETAKPVVKENPAYQNDNSEKESTNQKSSETSSKKEQTEETVRSRIQKQAFRAKQKVEFNSELIKNAEKGKLTYGREPRENGRRMITDKEVVNRLLQAANNKFDAMERTNSTNHGENNGEPTQGDDGSR